MVVFAITAVLPGDAAQQALGQFATPEQVAALRLKLGLDQPGVVRYLHWLMNLLSGDMGVSVSNAMPVSELMEVGGIDIVGLLPAELQSPDLVYLAASPMLSEQPVAAKALIDFLTGPAAKAVYKAKGLHERKVAP